MLLPTASSANQSSASSASNPIKTDAAAWSGAVENASAESHKQGDTGADKTTPPSQISNISGLTPRQSAQNTSHHENAATNIGRRKLQVNTAKQGVAVSALQVQHGQKDKATAHHQTPAPAAAMLSGVVVPKNLPAADAGAVQQDQNDKATAHHQTPSPAAAMLSGVVVPKNLPAADAGAVQQEGLGNSVEMSDGKAETASDASSGVAPADGREGTASNALLDVIEHASSEDVKSHEVSSGVNVSAASGTVQNSQHAGLVGGVSHPAQASMGRADGVAASVQSTKSAGASTMASLMARGVVEQAADAFGTSGPKILRTAKQLDASSVMPAAQLSSTLTSSSVQGPGSTTETGSPTIGAQSGGSIDASSPSALAATVTAMQQAGQSHTLLRLDPPGLGNMSVHLTLDQQGLVNVLFMPDTSAGAQALQSGLAGLGHSMAQAGLTLGQAQVGGQFGQNARGFGENARQWQGGGTSTPQTANPGAGSPDYAGVSAYA